MKKFEPVVTLAGRCHRNLNGKHANDAANAAKSLQFMPYLVCDNDLTGQKEGLAHVCVGHVSNAVKEKL